MSFLYFSSFIFKENHVSDKEDSPSQKVVEELNDIDINEIGNLKDLPTLVIIYKECGNPKVVQKQSPRSVL